METVEELSSFLGDCYAHGRTPRLISGMATYGLSEELLAAVIDGLGRKIAEQRSQPQDSGTGTARVKIKTAKNLKVGDISVKYGIVCDVKERGGDTLRVPVAKSVGAWISDCFVHVFGIYEQVEVKEPESPAARAVALGAVLKRQAARDPGRLDPTAVKELADFVTATL